MRGSGPKTANHLFCECEVTLQVSKKVLKAVGLNHYDLTLEGWKRIFSESQRQNSTPFKVRAAAFAAVMTCIWYDEYLNREWFR